MKLATLLDSHKTGAPESGALKDSFGDGYLLKKNRIYAAIRKSALAEGFRFTNKINENYIALSLSQLDKVMAEKHIPYLNNVAVLEAIEKKIPKLTAWDDIADNLKGNHVFHESCHAVAKTLTRDQSGKTAEEKILMLLLEESFANACELLAIIDADDQIHRIFYELNSYVYMLPDRANLTAAVKEMSLETVFRFLLMSYLHANFLREMNEKDFEKAAALASTKPLDPKQKKTLRALAKIAFQLNPRFREVTTRFYLKLNGITTDVASLKTFDFLKVLETNAAFKPFLNRASALLN